MNWDMARNYASLHKPDAGHEGLKVLNGIRVIAIGLVVLGHTFAFLRVDNQSCKYGLPLLRGSVAFLTPM